MAKFSRHLHFFSFLPVGLIAGAAALAYSDGLTGGFVFDDNGSIALNPNVRHLWPLWRAIQPARFSLAVGSRPLVNLSLAVNYALGGLHPFGYHLFNLLCHILAGLILYGLIRRIGDSRNFALAAALLWTLHPVQTEAVTYVIQRAEVMMGLFYLLTLYSFVRSLSGDHARRWAALSIAACFLGMTCKESMVSAPLIVLLYDRTFVAGSFASAWRRRPGYYLGLAATYLPQASPSFRLLVGNGDYGLKSGANLAGGAAEYWPTQFHAVVRYLELSLWPRPLIFDYGHYAPTAGYLLGAEAAAVLLLLAGAVWLLWRPGSGRRAWLGFLLACFFALLAPSSLVPLVRQTVAEHRLYLALAPVLIATLWLVERLLRPHRRLAAAVIGLWAVALGLATFIRNRAYASELRLYQDTVAKLPGNAYALNILGLDLAYAGRPAEAEARYVEALRRQPNFPEAENDLGNLLAAQPGRAAEAISHYQAALRLAPGYPEAHNNLAVALAKLPGRQPEAIAHYREAIRLDPRYRDAYDNLAGLLAKEPDHIQEAIADYEQALALGSASALDYNNLGVLCARLGHLEQAVRLLRKALALDPGYADARQNLAKLEPLLAPAPDRAGSHPAP